MTQDRYQAEVMDELRMQDEWQGLSKDEIRKLGWMDYMDEDEQIELVREIEAKLKEKNYGKGR